MFCLGGEKGIGLQPVISYPYFDSKTNSQRFPFRTMAMLCASGTHMAVSVLSRWLFQSGKLSADRWDVLTAFPEYHLTKTEYREQRNHKGRSNKVLHDTVVRLSHHASEGLLRDVDITDINNHTTMCSEMPSSSRF